jgi:hypothetical protein
MGDIVRLLMATGMIRNHLEHLMHQLTRIFVRQSVNQFPKCLITELSARFVFRLGNPIGIQQQCLPFIQIN